jgi:hypothetical protein
MWLIPVQLTHYKELIVESPLTFMAGNFWHFPLETSSVFCSVIGFPPLANSRNWHTATLFELQRETYTFCQQDSYKPISAAL